MNTATVGMAVTPTVVSTLLSHYVNRKPLKHRPTAHLSYDEGLHLIRAFLQFASHNTVEELQAFTGQWVPHPQWVKVEEVVIPEKKLLEAASALEDQLGPDGIRQVGGRKWWQWRKPKTELKAEWIEMRSDYHERKKTNEPCQRVMLYVHGGAYFFGSVDEHRYQMQRHARKLKARVFAPRYRLSPQFPFPCGLQDCIAAYLYLLTTQDPTTIILAGDSAGGGMVLSLLVTLRDRGIPLPAGAILISPWVDLTHSFPSVAGECPFDYIPQSGFHHKPSKAWPPLNLDEYNILKEQVEKQVKLGQTKLMKPASVEMKRQSVDPSQANSVPHVVEDSTPLTDNVEATYLSIELDGQKVVLKDQIQLYTTNELLAHPLVSPVMQPTLGGLPPLLIMTGGGEILRDEQIFLAHKCANPAKYAPPESAMHESAREQLARFKPTDVQLQVWDDLCHVAPTLSFTRPAKYMFRSIAQFGAWALARAQKTEIEILDDDDISIISNSGSEPDTPRAETEKENRRASVLTESQVGKAGDPLPAFRHHMIRQRVDRHGSITPLAPEAELAGCIMDREAIGVIKAGPVRKWLETRRHMDNRFGSVRAKIHKRRLKEMLAGYEGFDGEVPPPSALAGRRRTGDDMVEKRKRKSMGLAMWSLWGSKHDEDAVNREQEADKAPEVKVATQQEGAGARKPEDLQKQELQVEKANEATSRSRSRRRMVRDENQTDVGVDENTPVAVLLAKREDKDTLDENQIHSHDHAESGSKSTHLSPEYQPHETGITGKRPIVGGIAVPFTLNKEAETASMITLTSAIDGRSSISGASPLGQPADFGAPSTSAAAAAAALDAQHMNKVADSKEISERQNNKTAKADEKKVPMAAATTKPAEEDEEDETTPKAEIDNPTEAALAGDIKGKGKELEVPMMVAGVDGAERPTTERFYTASEGVPTAH